MGRRSLQARGRAPSPKGPKDALSPPCPNFAIIGRPPEESKRACRSRPVTLGRCRPAPRHLAASLSLSQLPWRIRPVPPMRCHPEALLRFEGAIALLKPVGSPIPKLLRALSMVTAPGSTPERPAVEGVDGCHNDANSKTTCRLGGPYVSTGRRAMRFNPDSPDLEKQILAALKAPVRTEGVRKLAVRFGVGPSAVHVVASPSTAEAWPREVKGRPTEAARQDSC